MKKYLRSAHVFSVMCMLVLFFSACGNNTQTGGGPPGTKTATRPAETPVATPTATPEPVLVSGAGWKLLKSFPFRQDNTAGYSSMDLVPVGGASKILYVARQDQASVSMHKVVFRSTDLGASWSALTLPALPVGTFNILTDPQTPDRVMLQLEYESEKGLAYISEDRGDHWKLLPVPVAYHGDTKVLEVHLLAGRIYVADYWTTDLINWHHWLLEKVSDSTNLGIMIDPFHPETLYSIRGACDYPYTLAGGHFVVCISHDGGQSWTPFLKGLVYDPPYYTPEFCFASENSAEMYAWGNKNGDILWSQDGGNSWQRIAGAAGAPLYCRSGILGPGGIPSYALPEYSDFDFLPEQENYNPESMATSTVLMGISNLGQAYHASSRDHTYRPGEPQILAGVSVYEPGKGWVKVAPRPFTNTFAIDYGPRIQLFTLANGKNLLFASYHGELYSYTGPLNF